MSMDWQGVVNVTAKVTGQSEIEKARKSLSSLESSADTLKTGFKALAGSFVIKEAVQFAKSIIDLGDEFHDLSMKTGIGVQALSSLKSAAEQSGLDFTSLEDKLRKYSVTFAKATTGNEQAAIGFKSIGVSLRGADGQIKSSNEVLLQLADRFSKLKDGPAKASAAVAIFGKSGADMIPLLNEGRKAIEGLGLQMSDDFATRADHFNDLLNQMKISAQQLGVNIFGALLPALEDIAVAFNNFSKTKAETLDFFKDIGEVLKFVSAAAIAATSAISAMVKINLSSGFFGAIKTLRTGKVEDGKQIWEDFKSGVNVAKSLVTPFVGPPVPQKKQLGGIDPSDPENASKLKREADAIEKLNIQLRETIKLRELEADRNNISNLEYERRKIAITEAAKGEKEATGFTKDNVIALKAVTSEIVKQKQAMEDLKQAQKESFGEGAKQGLNTYLEAAKDVANQTKEAFSHAFNAMEDSFVQFVKTGQLSFQNLADSIISDLARIAFKNAVVFGVSALAGGATAPGGGTFVGGGSSVGSIPVSGAGLRIAPPSGGGGSSVAVTVNMGPNGTGSTAVQGSQGKALGSAIAAAVRTQIMQEQRPGGLLS